MNNKLPQVELTNMIMIQDRATGKVVVQERVKSWTGITFPGGHVDDCESIVDSAIREVREETGLTVRNLESCGVIHWCHSITSERYIVFLYKTSDFSGELINETEEGKVFWVNIPELKEMKLSNNFQYYLPMFLSDEYSEGYGSWNENERDLIVYK